MDVRIPSELSTVRICISMSELSDLEAENRRLSEATRIKRLKQSIAELRRELGGDPAHPRSEGWEWDGDLGCYERGDRPQEHVDL
jgi:hypothetical protein